MEVAIVNQLDFGYRLLFALSILHCSACNDSAVRSPSEKISVNAMSNPETSITGRTDSSEASNSVGWIFSEKLEYHHCHRGFKFSVSTTHEGSSIFELFITQVSIISMEADRPLQGAKVFLR